MKLIEYVMQIPQYQSLKKKFPAMVKTAEEVEVVPWEEKYAVVDKNPEVIDKLNFLHFLYKEGLLTQQQFEQQQQAVKIYASKTLAISFIDEKKVSFRENPSPYTVLHELGHIHFEVNDFLWNKLYGGGEILFFLGLEGRYKIRERNIRHYFNLIKASYDDPITTHDFIAKKIAGEIGCYPHIVDICYTAGVSINKEEEIFDIYAEGLKLDRLSQIKVEASDLVVFFQNLIEGLVHGDSFMIHYAKILGIIG